MSQAVIRFIIVLRLPARGVPIPSGFREPIGAKTFDVGCGVGVEHGLHNVSADAGGSRDTMCVATTGHDKAFDAAALTDDESAVGCESGPSPEHTANA